MMSKGESVSWDSSETWELDAVHWSRPVLPLTESTWFDTIEIGSERGFTEWSLPMESYRMKVVNGWGYHRVEPFGGDPPALMKKMPALAHLWRINPKMRNRILGFDRFLRAEGFETQVPRWNQEWSKEAERRLAPLRTRDLANASDQELAEQFAGLRDFLLWAHSLHIRLHVICFFVRARFVDLCARLLGLSQFEAYELVQRTDQFHFRGPARLAAMARRALQDPGVSAVLERPADQALLALRGTWFEDELEAFLDQHGDQPAGFEIDEPTWREVPEVVIGMVKGLMQAPYDAEVEEAEFQTWRQARIVGLRAGLEGDALGEFDRWLALGELGYPLNETHNYLLSELPRALLRYVALETGRRLAAAGRIAAADDVFLLRIEELVAALAGEEDLHALVAERRAERERNWRLTPPAEIGPPLLEPPYAAFPKAVAEALRAILGQVAEVKGVRLRHSTEDTVVGLPGGPGVAEGPARIVRSLDEFEKVQAGDVIVCTFTNPAWTVLFPRAAALVADSGGPLSHAAIVAREYGLPSVVGTGDATRRIVDGQPLRVDGSAGTVTMLAPAEPKVEVQAEAVRA
jgi:pyruvate,water dikinase